MSDAFATLLMFSPAPDKAPYLLTIVFQLPGRSVVQTRAVVDDFGDIYIIGPWR